MTWTVSPPVEVHLPWMVQAPGKPQLGVTLRLAIALLASSPIEAVGGKFAAGAVPVNHVK